MDPSREITLTRRRALAAVLPVALAACGDGSDDAAGTPPERPGGQARLLAATAFARAIREPDRVTINVHVPYEGKLAGTDLFVPYNRIRQQQSRLPDEKSTPIAVYCRSGRMSAEAAATLHDLGYADVVELEGGMDAWEASGRSLVRPRG